MMSAALLPLLVALQAPQTAEPVRLWLNPQHFIRYGEPVRVWVEPARDGFLTVLRVDTRGGMHVIFPVEPGDDSFVRGGDRFLLYGRRGREAFAAFEPEGEGTVLAALSDRPYEFGELAYGEYWSDRLMGFHRAGYGTAHHVEALVDLVSEVAGGADFDYTVATYRVWGYDGIYRSRYLSQNACFGFGDFPAWYYGYPHYGDRGYAWSFHYRSSFYGYYDPFALGLGYYDPFACSGFGRPFFPRTGIVVFVPTRPGVPVDRDGFTRKKGDSVKPYEPRRRDPGSEVARGGSRGGDLLPVKRPRDRGRDVLRPARPDRRPSDPGIRREPARRPPQARPARQPPRRGPAVKPAGARPRAKGKTKS